MMAMIRRRSSGVKRVNSPVEPFGYKPVNAALDQPIGVAPQLGLVDFAARVERHEVRGEDTT